MTVLPDFTEDGLLPPGDYVLTLEELKRSMLVQGPLGKRRPQAGMLAGAGTWWRTWASWCNNFWRWESRRFLPTGRSRRTRQFPTTLTGIFVCDERRYLSGALQRDLNLIDPYRIWTWDWESRRSFRGYQKAQLPMWHRYRVELYPHYGQSSGIRDEFGHPWNFLQRFASHDSWENRAALSDRK